MSQNVTGIITGVVVLAKGVSGPLGVLLSTGKLTYTLGSLSLKCYQRHRDITKVWNLTEALEQNENVIGGLYNDIFLKK